MTDRRIQDEAVKAIVREVAKQAAQAAGRWALEEETRK